MRTPRLAGDHAGTAALLAIGWLLGMIVLDLVLPSAVVPDPLFAIAPLIACSVLSPRVTAGFGVAAICPWCGRGGGTTPGTVHNSGYGFSTWFWSALPLYCSPSSGCTASVT